MKLDLAVAMPILVAALTGLSFLAYKHPAGYRSLSSVARLLWVFIIGIAVWDTALVHAALQLAAAGLVTDRPQAIRLVQALWVFGDTPTYFTAFGTLAFIEALRWLPDLGLVEGKIEK